MAEELQSLLEKIQRDGVGKAEAEAEKIVAAARQKADALVQDARKRAEETTRRAEQDAAVFAERGRTALEQAARDVVLSVGQAIAETLRGIVRRKVAEALSDDALREILSSLVTSYFAQKGAETGGIEILLPPDQQKRVVDFFLAHYAKAVQQGVTIRADNGLVAGFRVAVRGENVEHDFSDEAISEALCQLLRPHLAQIVRKATAP
jgi:V/A-type H+-transporting ATPase subunit E